jgi:hypothetical protein
MTNDNGEIALTGMSSPLSTLSSRPALRNKWVFTGQCGFFGKSEIKLRPAAQYNSPPKESAIRTSKFRNEMIENGERISPPSRGPILLFRNIRKLVDPPSWNRSEK